MIVKNIYYDIEKLFTSVMRMVGQAIIINDLELKEINEEIINLSNKEKNIILAAFLQLFIFIIIQFFEISSVNLTLKKEI